LLVTKGKEKCRAYRIVGFGSSTFGNIKKGKLRWFVNDLVMWNVKKTPLDQMLYDDGGRWNQTEEASKKDVVGWC